MRNFFLSLVLVLGISACSDGDLIVTNIDFDDISFDVCGDVGEYVFYKINNTNYETFSFKLSAQDSILSIEDTIVYNIDALTNVVNYRTFNSKITASYFCSSIPPFLPVVKRDYTSSQGNATVATRIDTTIVTTGTLPDTTIVRYLNIRFTNLRLESENEIINQNNLNFGTLETKLQ